MVKKNKLALAVGGVILLGIGTTFGVMMSRTPYTANIPSSIMTPDQVNTQFLGELSYFDGMPTKKTVTKVETFLDLSRAVRAFLDGMPAASIYAMLEGFKEAGAKPGELVLFDKLMDARTLFLSPNSTTPYAFAEINVKDEPMVVEVPAGVLGGINDAFFRHVTDVGQTGKDKGEGGKYLLVGPDYKGDIPEGYIVARTPTYRHWLFMRSIVKDGDLKAATHGFKTQYNAYPLSQAANPPSSTVHKVSGKKFNTIHANNEKYFNELDAVVQYEPTSAFSPEIVGTFAAIGIKKGQPFKPDQRMQKILVDAANIANAASRSIVFQPRNKQVYFYPDRQWYSPFAGGSHEFLNQGERRLDDRVMFHYYATGITPAMVTPKVGTGSAYELAVHDAKGDYLNGSNTYKVTLPGPVPAKNFWSFMAYSGQTRSMLETHQRTAGIDSNSDKLKANKDGSYTVWFSPKAPNGKKGNWVQTVPNKSFNVLLRLYAPLEPWFDKTWKPSDFELVKKG